MTFGQSFLNAFAFIFSLTPPTPYVFTIKNKQQVMVYAGTTHSYEPSDKQYAVLKKHWKQFLEKNRSNSTVVIERPENQVNTNARNLSDAIIIEQGADTSLINQWANKEKIPVVGADVTCLEQTKILLSHYNSDLVYYWNFACLTEIWGRTTRTGDFKTWIMPLLHSHTGNTTLTLEYMKKLHEKFSKTPFNPSDWHFFHSITHSKKSKSILNQLSKETMKVRDAKIVAIIKKLWGEGKNIFIVFGESHAHNQEATLRKALT